MGKSPPNLAKSGQKTVFWPYLRRYNADFAQTPKVSALPTSRTCFHTTEWSKIAIFDHFWGNCGKLCPRRGKYGPPGAQNRAKIVKKLIVPNRSKIGFRWLETDSGAYGGVENPYLRYIRPYPSLSYMGKSTAHKAESGQNTPFWPYLQRQNADFAQTPEVAAPPSSRTCSCTTESPRLQ